MNDVQNSKPDNGIELEKVGVEGIKKYVVVKRPDRTYHAIVTINSFITLPSILKGAHMSRFIESVEEIPQTVSSIEDLAEQIAKKASNKHGFHCITEVFSELPFEKIRVNGGKENSVAKMFARYSTHRQQKTVGISLTGALACPCSKEMCKGLTHNQRGELTVELSVTEGDIELSDVIDICNGSFSSPVYSLLKRPDEKRVVENMHNNPMFVEDVVRKCVQLLRAKYSGENCNVKCVSWESIHDHNVVGEWKGKL